jgi:hypothetical protein
VRIPDKVLIGPYTYAVERGCEILLNEDKEELIGKIDHDLLIIRLWGDAPPEVEEAAFLHEVIHAIDELCQMGLDEKHIKVLAPMLYAFLRDNDLLKEVAE